MVSFRGLILIFRRASPSVSYGSPPPGLSKLEAEFHAPQPTQDTQPSETATLATTSAASGSATSAASGSQAASSSPATPSEKSSPEGKPLLPSYFVFGPDGKQLKPLQLSYSQFILANIKILESLFTKSPREAADYLTYLKFLAIKGTRFQTKALLAFDQDYRATKARDNFGWGTNLDDLSAQYFDAAVARRPSRNDIRRDSRGSANEEFCFRWNFNSNGCPNPQSCRYKHVCIHCSSTQHKGKSCSGTANAEKGKK